MCLRFIEDMDDNRTLFVADGTHSIFQAKSVFEL